ncbi:MAG: MFS transporter [Planctomycetia bacterium]|nr:MFS transporter [Planctomycetia bacterium]
MSQTIDTAMRPSRIRFGVLSATTAASVILYVHRAFVAEILKFPQVRADLHLTDADVTWILSAFFWSYALLQVPCGWLADRFGRRIALAIEIVLWSLVTAMSGFATTAVMLFSLRFILGIAQAGAYPAAGGLIGRWFPLSHRAAAVSLVTSGGRVGGIITPLLTSYLIAQAGMPWRQVMVLYGAIGIAIGLWYWLAARNEPEDHPRCNLAEQELISFGRVAIDPNAVKKPVRAPIYELLASRSIWCMAISQFGTNLGWAFIITVMPTYLKEAKGAGDLAGGWMGSMIWAAGALGMILGGPLTDRMTRRFGMRWGRMGTMIVTRFISAGGFLIADQMEGPWATAVALGAVMFFCDLGIPAAWAFAQDVGGRSVGAVLGWSNMVGNLGAAATPYIYDWFNYMFESPKSMEGTLYAGMVGFLVAGVSALGIDASKPLVPEESDVPKELPKDDA